MSARLPAPERRRQLLDVALETFAARGFHQTSMADVAVAAGVTKPVLYQHFRSKRALYQELLADVGNQLIDTVTKATAEASGPRRQVEAGFAAYARFVEERQAAFRLMFGGGSRRDVEFADAVRKVEDAMAEVIASLIDADIDTEHRLLLGHALVGMAEGAARRWDGADPEVVGRRLADMAWAGLRAVKTV